MERTLNVHSPARREIRAWAYCPICTHVVATEVIVSGGKLVVKPRHKCPRCSASLEAASVVRYEAAA
jgi:hypothetical protein